MKLVVVSNRFPFLTHRAGPTTGLAPAPGGVAGTLRQVLSRAGGTWVGWNGELGDGNPSELSLQTQNYTLRAVRLSHDDVRDYYLGFSNQVLWPVCHSFPEKRRFYPVFWSAYKRVNMRFAEAAHREYHPDCIFWIHDYHLTLVPRYLRSKASESRIGFFWHIPFPRVEALRELPFAGEVIAGLMASDAIGFHTRSYAENFMDAAEELFDCRVDRRGRRIDFEGRVLNIAVAPIGIDVAYFQSLAANSATRTTARTIRSWIGSPRLAVSVDRVDYTKGILERLTALDRLFESRRELRGHLSLLQIATPSRETIPDYCHLDAELEAAVAHINGRYSTDRWQPVFHVRANLDHSQIVACYQAADLALVTPLRDGMNLVAKEYVASQTEESGVLVLSQHAGVADTFGADAILIDPHEPESIMTGIQRALNLTHCERVWRMRRLRQSLDRNDVHEWATAFLRRLENGCLESLKPCPEEVILTA